MSPDPAAPAGQKSARRSDGGLRARPPVIRPPIARPILLLLALGAGLSPLGAHAGEDPLLAQAAPSAPAPASVPSTTPPGAGSTTGTVFDPAGATTGPATDARPARPARRALPVWEAGLGVATFTVPDYRGSDERRAYVAPFPYVIYRGDWFKIDREGLRARLFDDQRIDIELSAAATFALRARENRAREGMPALGTMLEIGPEIVYHLNEPRRSRVALDLRVPVRAAFALGGGDAGYQGWTASPSLRMLAGNVGGTGFDGMLSVGAQFATRGYQSYYYSVSPGQATADRPAYQAGGGFGGWQMLIGSSRRIGNWWLAGYLRYDALSGAGFVDSPLVRSRHFVTAGVAVAWVFGRSSERVQAPF